MHPNGTCQYIRSYDARKNRAGEMGQYIVSLLLLCLMSMDFKTRFFYFAFILFGTMVIMQRLKFEIPQAVIPAAILAVSMCLFSNSTRGWALAMIRPLAYPLCVIVGYNLVLSNSREEMEKKIVGVAIALAIGAYCHYFLNMIINWGKTTDRNTIDIWTRTVISATGQSSLASLMIGIGIPMLFLEIKGKYKIIASAIIISIVYYNLMLGGRTLFILLFALLIINIMTEWIKNRKPHMRLRIIVVFLLLVILFFCIIHFNLFGVVDTFQRSNFFARFFSKSGNENVIEDNRMSYKILYLKKMHLYPFGGDELHRAIGNRYAHDIFLDTYSDAGVFAFISVLIMVGCYIARTTRMYFNRYSNPAIKKILANLMMIIMVMFCTEPTIESTPWLFASFCVLYGSISRQNEYNII